MAPFLLSTVLTSKVAVSASALALLGGGAALATNVAEQPPEPAVSVLDSVPPDGGPVEPDVPAGEDVVDVLEDEPEAIEDEGDEDQDAQAVEAPEEEGNAWALGSDDARLGEFCAARMAEAEAPDGEAVEGDAEEDAESVGVPPFCTAGEDGGPVAPNAHGQDTAEQARSGDRPDDAGPPESASSNRPDDVPPGPPADVPRGDEEADEGESEAPVEPAGEPDATDDGPPANANANGRANRDR